MENASNAASQATGPTCVQATELNPAIAEREVAVRVPLQGTGSASSVVKRDIGQMHVLMTERQLAIRAEVQMAMEVRGHVTSVMSQAIGLMRVLMRRLAAAISREGVVGVVKEVPGPLEVRMVSVPNCHADRRMLQVW